MAERNINVQYKLRGDSLANWTTKNPVLAEREPAIVVIPADSGSGLNEPAVLLKIGDGTTHFNDLGYVSAIAGDVPAWAKAANKPTYNATEIVDLEDFIADHIEDTDTQYKLEQDTNNGHILKFYSKGLKDTEWTLKATITTVDTVYDDTAVTGRLTSLETLVGSTAVATQIANAIAALDLANTYEAKGAAAVVQGNLDDYKTSNDAAIAAINDSTNGILAKAKTYADGKASDAETAAKDYADTKAAAAETAAKGYADTKAAAAETSAKSYTDTKDTAMGTRVGAVETRMTAAEEGIDDIEEKIGDKAVATQISEAIAAEDALAQGYADAAEAAAKTYTDELESELANVAKSGAAADVAVDNEGVTATNLDDAITELVEMIDAGGTGSVVTVEKNTSVEGIAARYTIKQGGAAVVGGVIDIPKDMVVESGSVVTDPAGQPKGTYLKLVLANATEDEIYINVSTLIEYVTAGDDTATCHVVISADHKVQVNVIDGSIGATQLDTATNNALAKAHEHSNKTVLDSIDAAKVNAWDAAEQNAKDYADELDEAMDARVEALEAVGATKVEASQTNGNIKINGVEKTVYTLPASVLDAGDTFIFDGGNA